MQPAVLCAAPREKGSKGVIAAAARICSDEVRWSRCAGILSDVESSHRHSLKKKQASLRKAVPLMDMRPAGNSSSNQPSVFICAAPRTDLWREAALRPKQQQVSASMAVVSLFAGPSGREPLESSVDEGRRAAIELGLALVLQSLE
jgi:hypothetical protein